MGEITIPLVDSENSRTVSDDNFDGVDDDTLPEVDLDLSCKTESDTKPSIVVDVSQDDKWVRIPVTEATMWENKDGEASITRTSRIHFPMEWGGVSVLQFIDGFLTQNDLASQDEKYDECRVFFYDDNVENDDVGPRYVIKQYGYIGGMGPTGDGEGRFWVYDPAKLLAGIPAAKRFENPTHREVITYVRNELVNFSVFDDIPIRELSILDVPSGKRQRDRDIDIPSVNIGPFEYGIPPVGLLTPVFEDTLEFFANQLLPFNKAFKSNRNNLIEVMEWYSDLVDARWWFEPTPSGPELITDGNDFDTLKDKYKRRYFADRESNDQIIRSIPSNENIFTDVDVLNNTAIVDMKPFNTVKVFGETNRADITDLDSTAGSRYSPAFSEEYPVVKVRYEPLYERAGEREYLPNPVESDKVSINGVRSQAKQEMRKHLAETTEGSIELRGEPHLEPYDYITTIPVCEDTFQNADAEPMTFEINAIKHEHGGNEQYTCELGVSIAVKDDKIRVVEKKRKEAIE